MLGLGSFTYLYLLLQALELLRDGIIFTTFILVIIAVITGDEGDEGFHLGDLTLQIGNTVVVLGDPLVEGVGAQRPVELLLQVGNLGVSLDEGSTEGLDFFVLADEVL